MNKAEQLFEKLALSPEFILRAATKATEKANITMQRAKALGDKGLLQEATKLFPKVEKYNLQGVRLNRLGGDKKRKAMMDGFRKKLMSDI